MKPHLESREGETAALSRIPLADRLSGPSAGARYLQRCLDAQPPGRLINSGSQRRLTIPAILGQVVHTCTWNQLIIAGAGSIVLLRFYYVVPHLTKDKKKDCTEVTVVSASHPHSTAWYVLHRTSLIPSLPPSLPHTHPRPPFQRNCRVTFLSGQP